MFSCKGCTTRTVSRKSGGLEPSIHSVDRGHPLKACLCRENPCSLIEREVNHAEATLSEANSIALPIVKC